MQTDFQFDEGEFASASFLADDDSGDVVLTVTRIDSDEFMPAADGTEAVVLIDAPFGDDYAFTTNDLREIAARLVVIADQIDFEDELSEEIDG